MRSIGGFLRNRNIVAKKELDQESVFYIFRNIIRLKFGEEKGIEYHHFRAEIFSKVC